MSTKKFVINLTAQIVAFIVNIGITFLLTPFIVNKLGTEAYGFVALANNFVNYATLITIALNSMAGRFISINIHKGNIENANKYFSSVFYCNLFIVLTLLPISLFIIFYLEKFIKISPSLIFDVKMLFTLCFINFYATVLFNIYNIATFIRNRLELDSIRKIIASVLKAILLLLLFSIFAPSVWYIGFTTLFCSIYIIGANIYFTRILTPELHIRRNKFDFYKVKELLSSGIWNLLTKLSDILSQGLDLLIANIFIGVQAMGLLSIVKTIPTVILSTFAMISNVFAPELTQLYAKGEIGKLKNELIKSIRILGFFSTIPLSLLYAYGDRLFALWLPSEDAHLLYILSSINTLAMCLALPQESLWNIFTITNRVKISSLNLLAFSSLIIGTIFIGVHLTDSNIIRLFILCSARTFWGSIRSLTFLPLFGAKCLNLKKSTFYPAIGKSVFSVAIITIISLIMKRIVSDNSWQSLFIMCLFSILCCCIINYFIILTQSDRIFFKTILKKIRNKHVN